MTTNNLEWLKIAQEIQSLSQTGLAFCENNYERGRYSRLTEIAAEIVSNNTQLEKESTEKILMLQPGYATPKVDVRSAVVKDDKLLLVRESTDGRWAMPGGWADVGDTPAEVAVRETFEESGFEVRPTKLIGVFDANRSGRPLELFHAFKLIFLCDLIGGEAATSEETTEVGFFPFDSLPELSSNRTNERHLDEIKEHLKDSLRPTFYE
ncbi:MAG: NUDIX hydrolase [Bacteroidetes bacterium]|nr:NUDIX hydrolase [Bacteroidota bacterium]